MSLRSHFERVRVGALLLGCLAPFAALHAGGKIVCLAPSVCLPQISIVVTNRALPDDSVGVYAVEDTIPAGCTVEKVGQNGRFDAVTRKVKWGPFFDHTARDLTWQLTATPTAPDFIELAGAAVFDTQTIAITGVRRVQVLRAQTANEAQLRLPAVYQPGAPLVISNLVAVAANVSVYAIENQAPAGWTVANISAGGTRDTVNNRIKWGPFFDHDSRVLTFQLTPPAGAAIDFTISGVASFDGISLAISGGGQIHPLTGFVTRHLPANFQPGVPFPVTLEVAPGNAVVYAVEEQVPAGTAVSDISNDGQFDPITSRIKWGPVFDSVPRSFSFQITSPATPPTTYLFAGTGSFDGYEAATLGPAAIAGFFGSIRSQLPERFLGGVPLAITNLVSPGSLVQVYAFEETIPAGWTVSSISDDGVFDADTRKIRWGPFFDNTSRAVTFMANPGVLASGVFSGIGSFDGTPVLFTGNLDTAAYLPGEVNSITRRLPPSARSGGLLRVTNFVSLASNVGVYALEETLPPDWQPVAINEGGTFDNLNHKVKWGPYFDASAREFRFEVEIPGSASGNIVFSGSASLDGQSLPIGGATNIFAIPNQVPVARDDSAELQIGGQLSLPVAALLANDSDANLDLLTLSLPALATEKGGTLVLAAGAINYTPPAGFSGADSFSYVASDQFGGAATARVRLSLLPAAGASNITGIDTAPGGGITLRFAGIPGFTYRVEASDSIEHPAWTTIGSKTAGSNGSFVFLDPDAASHSTRFYRTSYP